MSNELTLEILKEALNKLPPRPYPKRMYISQGDYRRMREACDYFGIFPELRPNVSPGFGMQIVPSSTLKDNEYIFDYKGE